MSAKTPRLSATVVARNEQPRIGDCLDSLGFCDEIVVIDGMSHDDTARIAREKGATVFGRVWAGCNDQKEFARTCAKGQWILNIDADERVSPELADEIITAIDTAESRKVPQGFRIPVETTMMYDNRPLRFAGWYPNRQKRLFLRERGRWDTSFEPHDRVLLDGSWGKLNRAIIHRPAGSLDMLEKKALQYGQIAHDNLMRRGLDPTWTQRNIHPVWRFFRSYILQAGIVDGVRGYRLSRISYLEAKKKYGTSEAKRR